jgi:hypothetical protein
MLFHSDARWTHRRRLYGHAGTTTVLVSRVTAPVEASALPFSVAPVVRVTEVSATMVPFKVEVVPRVAELPTCQTMLWAWAPPANNNVAIAVMRVEAI